MDDKEPGNRKDSTAYPRAIYLSHGAARAVELDHNGQEFFRVRVFLDADEAKSLIDVERVVYHLHPTFANAVRESSDVASRFEIRTAAWGEFNIWAEVHFNATTNLPALNIERYITLRVPTV